MRIAANAAVKRLVHEKRDIEERDSARFDSKDEGGLRNKAIFAAIIILAVVGILDVFLPNADVILLARTLQTAGSATVVVVY